MWKTIQNISAFILGWYLVKDRGLFDLNTIVSLGAFITYVTASTINHINSLKELRDQIIKGGIC